MKPWYSSALGRVLIFFFVCAVIALGALARADVVEFSDEELSRESVLPKFDEPEAVKKRLVPTDKRIEVEPYGTTALNDSFLSIFGIGADLEYHLTEDHAIGINAAYFFSSNSSYVSQIQQLPGASQFVLFNQNPAPSYLVLGEYEFTPYYGKISITKQAVLNLNISGTVRLGMMGLTPGGSSFAAGIGFNERFFFTRDFGLKLDLQGMIYQKTDVVSVTPQSSTVFNILLSLGALWYFPQL